MRPNLTGRYAAVTKLDPARLISIRTMDDVIADNSQQHESAGGSFADLAALLAAVGIYDCCLCGDTAYARDPASARKRDARTRCWQVCAKVCCWPRWDRRSESRRRGSGKILTTCSMVRPAPVHYRRHYRYWAWWRWWRVICRRRARGWARQMRTRKEKQVSRSAVAALMEPRRERDA